MIEDRDGVGIAEEFVPGDEGFMEKEAGIWHSAGVKHCGAAGHRARGGLRDGQRREQRRLGVTGLMLGR